MIPRGRQRISRKLIFGMTATGVLSVILAAGGFVLYEINTFRDLLVRDLIAKAEITGQNCSAAILFANKDDAQETLLVLESQPQVTRAAIYDGDGKLFVSFVREGIDGGIPSRQGADGPALTSDHLKLFHPIVLNNNRIGTMFLETDLRTMDERFVSYMSIAGMVLAGSILAAYGFATALQKRITGPLVELTETARSVSESQDFTVRAVKYSDDELGVLAETFNDMLDQIQERDKHLVRVNEGMRREIEERKKAVEVIRSSEERFRHLFQSHPLPMWVYEKESLRFLEVNESAVKVYGYSVAEFLEMRITEIRPPEDIQALMEDLEKPRDSLQSSGPWRHRLKDGTLIDVEIVSHETSIESRPAVLVVALDVTERRKAEHRLQASEERYRSLVSASSSIIWATDSEGRFVVPQKSWEQYTGQRWEEHAGVGWNEAFHPDDRPGLFADWQRARVQSANYESEGRLWHVRTNSYHYSVFKAVPLFNPDRSVREWIGTVTDVHAEKAAQEEIKRFNAELEERVRERTAQLEAANQELEAFSYSVSHDLRAPLRHVDGFSEMLKKRVAGSADEKAIRYADVISDSAKRMGQLIDELLIFSRMGRAHVSAESVDTEILVKEVLNELQPETGERKIDWSIHPLPWVSGDRGMLRLVFLNLISNAIKYTGKRGEASIEIGAALNGKEVEFYVRDNGAGFDMKYVDKLFGVFQRLHRSDEFEGIGIGLANVRRIVQRHGGNTWAEGTPDQGATFYFTLPVSTEGGS